MPPSSFHPCSQFFLLIISIVLRAITVCAYTWSFLDPPTQCGILSINISGSDGIPPFRVLIIPFGPSPLNNVEVRNLIDMEFSANASQVQFQLPYPENSQLVAVVSWILLKYRVIFYFTTSLRTYRSPIRQGLDLVELVLRRQ